jgi:hypothetical protein
MNYSEEEKDSMLISANLSALLADGPGEEFRKLLIDKIDQSMNDLLVAENDVEIARLRGAIQFGNELIQTLYCRVNIAKEIRKRKEDQSRKMKKRMDTREPHQEYQRNFRKQIYTKDAL